MKKKILKPTSSYFLSQKFWRILRRYTNRNLWTFLYIISQKFKIQKKVSELEKKNLKLKTRLNYPVIKKKIRSKKKFDFFLRKYNSSKPHGAYRKYLNNFFLKCNYPRSILELGISEGAGIYSLNNYFKYSYIWGCDIDKNTFIFSEKIKSGYCDQLKIVTIDKILKNFNTKFDIIIDDGWHHPESQINSILSCLPYLNYGGTYITEDIAHDKYWDEFNKIIKILNKKGFKTNYKKFFIKNKDENLAGTLNNGYLFIYRHENKI